jgi:hypothetical protein
MIRSSFRSMPCRLITSSSHARVPVFCTATRMRSAFAFAAPNEAQNGRPERLDAGSGLDLEWSMEGSSNRCIREARAVSTMYSNISRVAAILFGCSWAVAAYGTASSQEIARKQFAAEPARSAKERLSDKSADEQRVDNCKVPLESRGPKPRPDHCAGDASTGSKD